MVIKGKNNYAFIDSQNVNLAIRSQEWILDFRRFRIYLRDKYSVKKAYIFIGFLEGNKDLYKFLQESGYIVIFKPTLVYKDGTTKGNCDAELVLQAMIDYTDYDKAVIVTGDGDFYCLVDYLMKHDKLEKLLIPNERRYSGLLKTINTASKKYLAFMNNLKEKLAYKKKRAL